MSLGLGLAGQITPYGRNLMDLARFVKEEKVRSGEAADAKKVI
jgi:hypothetical protein